MKRLLWLSVFVCSFAAYGQQGSLSPVPDCSLGYCAALGVPNFACVSGWRYAQVDNPGHNYTCTGIPPHWVPDAGGGGSSVFTSNLGVGANNSSSYAPIPEVNYVTTGGTTAFACEEDQNRGDWDVRCTRNGTNWATNPSQALINTIQAAVCYHYTQSGPWPTVHLPAGSYSIGGNISLPPNVDVEGAPGQYGATGLTTTDPTQPMFTHVSSETFVCNGTNYTDNSGGDTLGNVTLQGGGPANANDVGLANNTGGSTNEYIHNIGFIGFGGPGRTLSAGANGQNSRGSYIFASGNLQWYMFSGAYNASGFTDTGAHCSLELYDLDSRWDHIEATGNLPDSGYYNRRNLVGVCLGGGGQNSWLKDSYIQLFPQDVYVAAVNNGGQLIQANRLDGAWWESINVSAGAIVANNLIQGYGISPTLNPVNFASNPGGVTTDANAAAIKIYQPYGLGSTILPNSIGSGIWSQWPVYGIWSSPNTLNGSTTTIEDPGILPGQIGGQIGGDNGVGNVGADVSRSIHQTSSGNHSNTGPTIHFQGFQHTYLADTATTNYTTVDGIWPDTYVTVEFRTAFDTVTPGSGITTCSGANITSGIHWFYTYDGTVLKEVCPSSSGSGGGLLYSSPTLYSIPAVSSTSGAGTVINSAFKDDTLNTYDSEPFQLSGTQYLEPTSTATGSANYPSNVTQWLVSYWNGTTAINTNWQMGASVGTGTTPATTLNLYTPPEVQTDTFNLAINPTQAATSGANINTPIYQLSGATWNGSASQADFWQLQGVQGTGTNPTSTLTWTHTGSTGAAALSAPSFKATGGTPGVNNNGSQWTGVSSLPATCNVGDYITNTAGTSAAGILAVCYPANHWNYLGGNPMSGTPTHVADGGAGTSPTITFFGGATDGRGWVSLTEGTAPTASAGLITIKYGGTYGSTPVCSIFPANANASALTGAAAQYVSESSSTSAQFVITGGSTTLTPGTVYIWGWTCVL